MPLQTKPALGGQAASLGQGSTVSKGSTGSSVQPPSTEQFWLTGAATTWRKPLVTSKRLGASKRHASIQRSASISTTSPELGCGRELPPSPHTQWGSEGTTGFVSPPAAHTQPGKTALREGEPQHPVLAANKEEGDPEGGAAWERSAGAAGGGLPPPSWHQCTHHPLPTAHPPGGPTASKEAHLSQL